MRKQYITPTIKEIPVALQQLLCDSPLSIYEDEDVDEYTGEGTRPNIWGIVW